ncbi:hypothetical protein CHFL109739_11165 [Chryseobacterium flavum]
MEEFAIQIYEQKEILNDKVVEQPVNKAEYCY